GERPGHRGGALWTSLRSRRTVVEVGAEEHHYAARYVSLAEMNVGLVDRRAQAGICQLECNGLGVSIEVQSDRGSAGGKDCSRLGGGRARQRANFLEPRELSEELLCAGICAEQHERSSHQCSRCKQFETHDV